MSMIFQFMVLSDENDSFVRDYRILYNAMLSDFHNHICEDLGFDPCAMASFFESDRQWNKLSEYTLMDMGIEEDGAAQMMSKVALDNLISENGDRLIYTFDVFGNRSLYLEMVEARKAEDGVQYPCTKGSEGDPPAQFDLNAIDPALSVFDDVMEEFADFEADENCGDDF